MTASNGPEEVTGMEHAIEQAAQVIRAAIERQADVVADGMHLDVQGVLTPHWIAEALATNGLLSPAPLTEEWATRFVNGLRLPGKDRKYGRWCKGDPPKGVNVRRYVTAWLPVGRADDDGRADQ